MKTVDYILSGIGAYLLYSLLTKKPNLPPVQEMPANAIPEHVSQSKIEDLKDQANKLNIVTTQNPSIAESSAGITLAQVQSIDKNNSTPSVATNSVHIVVPPAAPTTTPAIPYSKSKEGIDSFLVATGIPGLNGLQDKIVTLKGEENYTLSDVPFYNLSESTKTILLRCFSSDYTSPRMIKDEDLYNKSISAANRTGAPAGWVQYTTCLFTQNNPIIPLNPDKLSNAAVRMLEVCEAVVVSGKTVNLPELRNNAINAGLRALQS